MSSRTLLAWLPWALALLMVAGYCLAQPVAALAETAAAADEAADEVASDSEAEAPSTLAKSTFLASLTVFVLAVFVGFEIITKVPPTLHTPLMSGANAISGITLVGAVIAVSFQAAAGATKWFVVILGFIAVVLAAVNVIGGFMVTGRMLAMFKKKR